MPAGGVLERAQAVFVTLKREGRLRGCIGTVSPEYPLPEAVARAAVSAALDDPRFEPLAAKELAQISVEVTALGAQRPVKSWRSIELGRHGIVLERRGRKAVFLPQVPLEQHWTLPETLDALARKAGLDEGEWRTAGTRLFVFTGQVFRESLRAGQESQVAARRAGRREGRVDGL
jgi:AmmeMemoRadiSam system protein A